MANREPCEDFDRFKPLFAAVQADIDGGARITQPIRKDAGFLKTDIKEGEFFILGGQTAYVAEVGDPFKEPNGESDARLRVIHCNGTARKCVVWGKRGSVGVELGGRRRHK